MQLSYQLQPWSLYLWGRTHQHPADRSLGESQIQSWCCEEKKNFFPPPGTEPRFLGSPSHTLHTGQFHDLLFPYTLNLQCDVTLSTQSIRQTKDIPQLTLEVALSDMQVAEMKQHDGSLYDAGSALAVTLLHLRVIGANPVGPLFLLTWHTHQPFDNIACQYHILIDSGALNKQHPA